MQVVYLTTTVWRGFFLILKAKVAKLLEFSVLILYYDSSTHLLHKVHMMYLPRGKKMS